MNQELFRSSGFTAHSTPTILFECEIMLSIENYFVSPLIPLYSEGLYGESEGPSPL